MVKCSECGLLALQNKMDRSLVEVESLFRTTGHIHATQEPNLLIMPLCFMRAANLQAEIEAIDPDTTLTSAKTLAILQNERECEQFFGWEQGFSPKEHREILALEEQKEWQEARVREDREWRIVQEEITRQRQEQQSTKRLRWELLVFGLLVTAAVIFGQIAAAFISRGSWF